MSRILERNPDGTFPFNYRDSSRTDVAATFRRIAGPNWNKKPADAPKSGVVVSPISKGRSK